MIALAAVPEKKDGRVPAVLMPNPFYQVYAGAANENVFDGFYDTMPGAFRHIDTTIERTGRMKTSGSSSLQPRPSATSQPRRTAIRTDFPPSHRDADSTRI